MWECMSCSVEVCVGVRRCSGERVLRVFGVKECGDVGVWEWLGRAPCLAEFLSVRVRSRPGEGPLWSCA